MGKDLRALTVQEIEKAVLAKSKYRHIHPGLVQGLARAELEKGLPFKEVVKGVTGKLHQVAAAYFATQPDYAAWKETLQDLPPNLQDHTVQAYCRAAMANHHSTRERLPILETFFCETLAPVAPLHSVLDLACGLDPLALPWMPVAEDVFYAGCDIFMDMLNFLADFATHFSVHSQFKPCNLLDTNFGGTFQVAFLLKTLPCLEQLEKGWGAHILDAVPADYLLISYPIRSLGGRAKGMRGSYARQFEELMRGRDWQVHTFEFTHELAYLVKKR